MANTKSLQYTPSYYGRIPVLRLFTRHEGEDDEEADDENEEEGA